MTASWRHPKEMGNARTGEDCAKWMEISADEFCKPATCERARSCLLDICDAERVVWRDAT